MRPRHRAALQRCADAFAIGEPRAGYLYWLVLEPIVRREAAWVISGYKLSDAIREEAAVVAVERVRSQLSKGRGRVPDVALIAFNAADELWRRSLPHRQAVAVGSLEDLTPRTLGTALLRQEGLSEEDATIARIDMERFIDGLPEHLQAPARCVVLLDMTPAEAARHLGVHRSTIGRALAAVAAERESTS